jgi:hypothetical protein
VHSSSFFVLFFFFLVYSASVRPYRASYVAGSMEYRCYVVGDTVTEPGALLRRLLYLPFLEQEERKLRQQSLLFTRSEEAKGTHAYPMAVSLPNLQDARVAAITFPNPSMPSVDVTVQFAAITDRRDFERVMLSHYSASSARRGFTRSPRRSSPSQVSSFQDLMSSEASSLPGGAHGVALQAPPHAIVITFNPFSMSSFSKLRVEWVHSLRVLRQQRQQLVNSAAHQQQQQQQLSKRSTSSTFPVSSVPASPLTPGYPVESVESFPVVLLVATRMELLRDTMEATPSVHVPSSLDVTEVARALQAQVYAEVGTDWDESIDVLRAAIARACMGELTNAPLVTYNAAYGARQASIAHAIEAVQMDPYGDDENNNGEDDGGTREWSAGDRSAAVGGTACHDSHVNSGTAPSEDHTGERRETQDSLPRDASPSGKEEEEGAQPSGETKVCLPSAAATDAVEGREGAKKGARAGGGSFNSASVSVLPAAGSAEQDEQQAPTTASAVAATADAVATSELSLSDAALRSADPSSFMERSEMSVTGGAGDSTREVGGEEKGMQGLGSTTKEATSPQSSSMRGRQLRRYLVTALAPLVVPAEENVAAVGGLLQGSADRARPPPPLPSPTSPSPQQGSVDAAAPAKTSSSSGGGRVKGHRHRRSTAQSRLPSVAGAVVLPSRWTWRRHPRTGRVFYVHRASGKSQYDCPDDYDGPQFTTAAAAVEDPVPQANVVQSAKGGDVGDGAAKDAASAVQIGASPKSGGGGEEEGEEEGQREARDDADDDLPSSSSEKDQRTHEDINSWRQLQQLQLRRTQVKRLEHQVHQLRLQSERLRAQSQANADLKHMITTLRKELDDKEQAFSAQVAEQNQQLAKEVLYTTVAVEELSAALAATPLPPTRRTTDGGEGSEHEAEHSLSLTGCASEIQQADADLKSRAQSLQLALSRRDAEAQTLAALQRRRQHVTQRMRESDEELTALLKRTAKAETALLAVDEQLDSAQAEEQHLRKRVQELEERHLLQEQRRRQQLQAYVDQKRSIEMQLQQWERLQCMCARAHDDYNDAVRHQQRSTAVPSTTAASAARVLPAEAQEENKRLRLGVESTTGRCAQALLRSSEAVCTLTSLLQDVGAAVKDITAQRATQRRRLTRAHELAQTRLAEAVQLQYSSPSTANNGRGDVALRRSADTINSLLYDHDTPTELLEVAVDACAESLEQWRQHDTLVTAPLLERAASMEAELLLLLRGVADDVSRSPQPPTPTQRGGSGGDHHRRYCDKNQHTFGNALLWHRWLQSTIARLRHDVEERCRAPLRAFSQHLAVMHSVCEVNGKAEGAADRRACESTWLTGREDDGVSLPTAGAFSSPTRVSEYGVAFENGLWSTCDVLVKRLTHLDHIFASSYAAVRELP